MTMATNQNMTDMTNNSSKKYDECHNLSVIEEHELDYKRRLKFIEFTGGFSEEELIRKKANSHPSSDIIQSITMINYHYAYTNNNVRRRRGEYSR
jgi:hypothetical protein